MMAQHPAPTMPDHHDHHDHSHHGHAHGAGQAHGHGHGHGHAHVHAPASFDRAFAIGITLNIGFVAVEAFYGWHVDSLALLAEIGRAHV